ncbi:hypothetical protein ES708_15743 [subsurface metagenome]
MTNKRILTLVSLLLISLLLAGCWIVAINRPPVITSDPVTTATAGTEYTYQVVANDPDTGDVLTYSITTYTRDMIIIDEYTGLITWTSNLLYEGDFPVTVVVTDGGGLFDFQDFTIVVSAAPSNDATLSDLTVDGETIAGFAPAKLKYDVELPYGATRPTIVATPTDPNAKVHIGMEAVFDPPVTVPIKVTAEDGTILTYKITFTVADPVAMEIIVDLPEFKVGKEAAITVNIVANDDDGKMVNGYFILPEGDYQIECLNWAFTIPLLPGNSYIAGPPGGYSLVNQTINFIATFNSAGTYSMTVEVREVGTNALLCSKDIEIVVSAATVAIGDSFGGGIVAYIDGTGEHGLIAATVDQSTGIQWYNGTNITTGATGTAIGTGQDNTTTIVTIQGIGNYAAQLCNDLTEGGYDDWFLPSQDELEQLYLNKVAIGSFDDLGFYWSSSESNATFAWCQDFGSGNQSVPPKVATFRVRAVRYF